MQTLIIKKPDTNISIPVIYGQIVLSFYVHHLYYLEFGKTNLLGHPKCAGYVSNPICLFFSVYALSF